MSFGAFTSAFTNAFNIEGSHTVYQVVPDSLSVVERVHGYSFSETAGSSAKVELRAGSSTGAVVAYLNLAAGGTSMHRFPKPQTMEFPGGCYTKQASGSVAGVLYMEEA